LPTVARRLFLKARAEWYTYSPPRLNARANSASKADGLRARPATAAWLDKIHLRPAYRAALGRGGPYMFA
jgi:hypothetical protein